MPEQPEVSILVEKVILNKVQNVYMDFFGKILQELSIYNNTSPQEKVDKSFEYLKRCQNLVYNITEDYRKNRWANSNECGDNPINCLQQQLLSY